MQPLAAVTARLFFLRQPQPGALRYTLPHLQLTVQALALAFEFVVGCAELRNGLLCQELLQCPLLDVLRFILLELRYERHGPLKNGSLVLLVARDYLSQLVDAFIDGFPAPTLD